MQLTKNFHLSEFACRDGSVVPGRLIDNVRRLAEQLQVLRESISKPIVIISAYRTPGWNAKVKGAKSSQHMLAKAADIRVLGYTPGMVKIAIESLIKAGKMRDGGVGLYKSWVHYDCGPAGRRWDG